MHLSVRLSVGPSQKSSRAYGHFCLSKECKRFLNMHKCTSWKKKPFFVVDPLSVCNHSGLLTVKWWDAVAVMTMLHLTFSNAVIVRPAGVLTCPLITMYITLNHCRIRALLITALYRSLLPDVILVPDHATCLLLWLL